MTYETGTVRVPWKSGTVRLESPEGGEIREGFIDIPNKIATAEKHTNDYLLLEATLDWAIDRWNERMLKPQGYEIEGAVKWWIVPIPVGRRVKLKAQSAHFNDDGRAEANMRVLFHAKVRLHQPQYVTYDDFDAQLRLQEIHGVVVDHKATKLPYNEIEADTNGKDYIEVDGGFDPMVFAEEQRQAKGIKREDYLTGPLHEPRG